MSMAMWKLTVLLVVVQLITATAVLVAGELHQGGPGGRFLVDSDSSHEHGAGGRRFLNGNLCGRGQAPDYGCQSLFRNARQPRCCKTLVGIKVCKDVGDNDDFHCGACNRRCGFRLDCCDGRCVDRDNDRNNCGRCGRRCRNNQPCQRGQCGYNGRA